MRAEITRRQEDISGTRTQENITGTGCFRNSNQIPLVSRWAEAALASGKLNREMVIDACDRMGEKLDDRYLPFLEEINHGNHIKAKCQLEQARRMLSRPWLEEKIKKELGGWAEKSVQTTTTLDLSGKEVLIREKRMPLGVLFHIGAGNMEGLPVYSVIEGLLSGNVNLVKAADGDRGMTAALLDLMITEEPALAGYIYVFDVPSEDRQSMKALGMAADGIVVWGGDEAITAVRQMAPANVKLIEWGHKTSFCYVTEQAWRRIKEDPACPLLEKIKCLAAHICQTNQLLCNSCQGIYLGTRDKKEFTDFARFFSDILEQECRRDNGYGEIEDAVKGRIAYQLRCMELERDKKVLKGEGCSVTLYKDNILEPSLMYRNCWIKTLPPQDIMGTLKGSKNHLHTAGLICLEHERDQVSELLLRTGIVRVTGGGDMSLTLSGEAHDGEYPLMRYSKIVSY